MGFKGTLGHTMKKSGLAESTEIDIYGLILHKWGISSNIPFNPNSNYELLLKTAASLPCSIVTENIKELNHILLELTRLYKRIEVRFQTTPYHYKLIIICFG